MQAPVFRAEDHTYWVGGEQWPSVTTVLKIFGEYEGIPAEYLAAAAEFGRHVHLAIHLFDSGSLVWNTLDPRLQRCVTKWSDWLVSRNATVLASEVLVWHPRLRYCGQFDKIVRIPPHNYLLDVKSSAKIPRFTAYQTAAYREAYLTRPGALTLHKKRLCVRISEDDFEQKPYVGNTDHNMFISALNVTMERARYGH